MGKDVRGAIMLRIFFLSGPVLWWLTNCQFQVGT
jgi:hypothetical protein